jgi:glutamyl-tRNA reductase
MSASANGDTLLLVGLSHHTAAVALRERLAFRGEDQPRALSGMLARGFREAVILSTCNRVEIIAVSHHDHGQAAARIRQFLAEHHAVPEREFQSALYELQGNDAARHIFEVAASLDSQILGESEILSQSREAFRISAENGACGPLLRGVFERSFFLAKELRSEGGIGRVQASVSSAAVALANKVFEVKGRKVLLVGTGEMATGIVRALRSAGVGELWVASRTAERATEFAHREGGKPCGMHDISEQLVLADIVLVSSAAPHFIIGPAQMEQAIARRRGRSICMIDISVPRNIDPEISNMAGDIFLFDIDDLEEVARDGRREREAVAARWRPRLVEEARGVLRELQDTGPRETARRLIAHANTQRSEVLELARSAGLDEKAVEELSRALERLQGKFLHGPLETLKQAAREGDGSDASAWISRLFRLEADVSAPEQHGAPTVENGTPAPAPRVTTVPKSCKEKPAEIRNPGVLPISSAGKGIPPVDLGGATLAQSGP